MIVYLVITALSLTAALWVRSRQQILLPGGPAAVFIPQHAMRGNAGWTDKDSVRARHGRSRADAMSAIALALIFCALFIPEALRVNVGNDYLKYADFMHLIHSNAYVPTEVGFNVLVYCVYELCGFENYLLVFALFAAMTIGLFLAAIRQQAEDFTFSFFLFMMLGYYFQTYNTVRYYFALSIVLFSLRFLLRREYLPWLVLVLLAATFHKSVLVVLVLYPLALIPWRKWLLAIGALGCISLTLFQSFWLRVVVALYPSYEDTEYLEGSGFNPVNIARCAAVLVLAGIVLYCRKRDTADKNAPAGTDNRASFPTGLEQDRAPAGTDNKTSLLAELEQSKAPDEVLRLRFCLHATVLALALYVFCSFLPIISRIGYYLTMPQIFLIPQLLLLLPDRRGRSVRKVFTGLVILAAVCYFLLFLRKLGSAELRILPYQTFFFTDMPEILSEMRD